jgi:hypothetical protein
MGEHPRTGTQARDSRSLERDVQELMVLAGGGLYIGHPNNPLDPTDTSNALGTAATHNGTRVHFLGSWVQWTITAVGQLGVQHTFVHNLNVPPVSVTTPNVLWHVLRKEFGGNVVAGSFTDVHYGDVAGVPGLVTADSIQLIVSSNLAIGGGDDLRITLWFTPALR